MAKGYLVFSPTGPTEPKKLHLTHKSAFHECHQMAKKFPGQQFYVAQIVSRMIEQSTDPVDAAVIDTCDRLAARMGGEFVLNEPAAA